jgi:hypothetical protein
MDFIEWSAIDYAQQGKAPLPTTMVALACLSAAKKYPSYSEKARAAAAIGAEKPAKKQT